MRVLGIDTSTPCGSVGLIDDEEVLSECLLNIPVTHSERILAAVEHVLREAGCAIQDLHGWAITLGPGSFTGVRIGVSTVKGLAYATGKPVAGIPTLDGLAAQVSPTPYLICPILDARKQEVYTAFYRYGETGLPERQSVYRAVTPQTLIMEVTEKTIFIGDGVKTYAGFLLNRLSPLALFPLPTLHLLRGSTVARLGLQSLRKNESLDLSTLSPTYVRPSEAEMKWQGRPSAKS